MNRQQTALLALGTALKADRYRFVAPTPLTYGRVLARRRDETSAPLVEAFGWNRPFSEHELSASYRKLLHDADMLESTATGELRSCVRFSTIDELIFAHSGYPTTQADSVFFGPDTYRFVRTINWLADSDPAFAPRTIVDVGAGSGAGGIYAGNLFQNVHKIVLADINVKALEFAQVNAVLNGVAVQTCESDVLRGVAAAADLVICNPPYLIDRAQRAYRHGGGDWGCSLAARILDEALGSLTETGQLLLYTGTPVVAGADKFLQEVGPVLETRLKQFRYAELDPDVFGEELESPPYDQADRIATVVLHVKAADLIR